VEGLDLPAVPVPGEHEGLHRLVVRACGVLAGGRHRARGDHDRHVRADEPQRRRRCGVRIVQTHPGAGQGAGEEAPVPLFDRSPAAPVRSVPGDEVGVVGEERRIARGVAAVPGRLQGLAELVDLLAAGGVVWHVGLPVGVLLQPNL
jgi:hypothetical protein